MYFLFKKKKNVLHSVYLKIFFTLKNVSGLGGKRGRIWEFGTDLHTLLCLRWIMNEDLIYSKITTNPKTKQNNPWNQKKKKKIGVKYI